ncbi:MAG: PhnD/SsuA/transferrin family substrate-binding protein [Thiobacillus sp.]
MSLTRRQWLLTLALMPRIGQATPRPAVFVVHPYDTPSRIYARFRPLTLYLGGVLGRPVRLVIASTYDEQIEMIATGRADLAYIGPTPYVRARERGRVTLLAGEAEGGQAFYQSAVVVRADSPYQQLTDLVGKRVAFGAEISMSSAVAPKLILARAGVRRADLAEIAHLDRHERVALSVLHGDFDAGGLRLDIAKAYLPRGLRVLATSQPLPPHVIAASPRVISEDASRVRLALLYPDATGHEALRALGPDVHFVELDDAHFSGVRGMLRMLESW